MKEILKYWEKSFYTGGISFLLAILALFVSIWKHKKYPRLKPLLIFLLAYTLGQLFVLMEWRIGLFPFKVKHRVFLYADFIDTIIEFLTFFYVIRNSVVSTKLPGFLGWVVIYFSYYNITNHDIDNYFLQAVFTIQASFLIIACMIYYKDLFTTEPKLILKNDASFWTVTGIEFFMLCTFPFSIFGLYLVKVKRQLYDQLFAIFDIFYWILFLMIIKAYFCKPVLTK